MYTCVYKTLWKLDSKALLLGFVHSKKQIIRKYFSVREVGKLIDHLGCQSYLSGELFIHKKFSYRGIILFPWTVTVYEQDKIGRVCSIEEQTVYQTLIDLRDWHYVQCEKRNDDVTFLPEQRVINSETQSIPGIDYVYPDDIQPYITGDTQPITHPLFHDFFHRHRDQESAPSDEREMAASVKWEPSGRLYQFRQVGYPWINATNVYSHHSPEDDICVRLIPFYLGHKAESSYIRLASSSSSARNVASYTPIPLPPPTFRDVLENSSTSLEQFGLEWADNDELWPMPIYSDDDDSRAERRCRHWWRLCVRVESGGEGDEVRVKGVTWSLHDGEPWSAGDSEGKVNLPCTPANSTALRMGRDLVLNMGQSRALQFSCHVALPQEGASIWGKLHLERVGDGTRFDCSIPLSLLNTLPDT